MTKTVFAHTPAGPTFPPYVNLSRKESGIYALTVRSEGNGGLDLGAIELSPEAVEALATAALAELHREPAASTVPPHQQRVLDEKRELDERLSKLDAFILDNPLYLQLPADEQDRLSRQSKAMAAYSDILGERIACF